MINTKTIGLKIAEARKKRNFSQAQLAEKLFISSQAVGKWERGESMPDIITFNRIAEILGVDLNYFSANFPSTDQESINTLEETRSSSKHPTKSENRSTLWDLSRGNWSNADFSGLNGLHDKLSSSNIQKCKFIASDLSGIHLKGNNVELCDFSKSIVRNSHVQRSNLSKNNWTASLLTDTIFSGSYVSQCDFSEADLSGVSFRAGGFEKNTIKKAVWNGTTFSDSNLANLIFEGTIENCIFENCSFKHVVFENAILKNTFFKNNHLKGVRFVHCSTDRLTYEFLKNGKADLSGIDIILE